MKIIQETQFLDLDENKVKLRAVLQPIPLSAQTCQPVKASIGKY